MTEETKEVKAVETPLEVELTANEVAAIRETLAPISMLENEIKKLVQAAQPVFTLIAKQHNVEPAAYALSQDGKKLVKREG